MITVIKAIFKIGVAMAAPLSGSLSFAIAAESSATNFPLGVNTALSAIYPPAGGTEVYDFNALYTSGSNPTTKNNPGLPPFHTLIFAEAVRVNHTWINLTNDISFGSGIAINYVHQTLNIPGLRANSGFQASDPDIIPYNIGFHVLPNLWIAHIFNIFPSWGQYSKNDVLNGGVGFSTYSPELAVTYLPTPKWEVSLDARYGFNTKNTQTSYRSGNDFNMDYNAGYRPIPSLQGLQVGLSGYLYRQIDADSRNGVIVGDGNRGQVFSIGPLIRYDIGHGGLLVKWQHELAVENRTKGEQFWFQFAVPL